MKVSEIYGGQYLKAADIDRKGEAHKIIGVRLQEFDDGKTNVVLSLEGREDEKELSLNKSNALALSEHYGDNADKWIGKVVHLLRGKREYMGKQVDAIYVSADNGGVPF